MEKITTPFHSFSFTQINPDITQNARLREPQRMACEALENHFDASNDPALVQIPVGCGKTGLISALPFVLGHERALIVAPNVTIREALFDAVDSGSKNCFWRNMRVAHATPSGPFAAKLDGADANASDCNDSHFVVTNVQQIGQANSKWLKQFPSDFFDVILLDEGHHNAAASWKRLMAHFPNARVISLTATPFRSDGKEVIGELVYRYPFLRSMARGYIKTLGAVHVQPRELAFTFGDSPQEATLEEVLKLREEVWFSRGVALADKCNRHIVDASIEQCQKLRSAGTIKHQIIAAACSVEHATQIAKLYQNAGFSALEIHSAQTKSRQKYVLEQLRSGKLDVIVQVQMLGEGFDHPPLSVAAIFRPFRTLSPYIQFVGRVMRVNQQRSPGHADNQGVIVSHVGLNTERHWSQFRELDAGDQCLWAGLATGCAPAKKTDSPNDALEMPNDANHLVQVFSPQMLVDWEIADADRLSEFGDITDELPSEHEQFLMKEAERKAAIRIAGPQQRRRESRSVLKQGVEDSISTVLNKCRFSSTGTQIGRAIPQLRNLNNWSAVRYWCYCELNRLLKRKRSKVQNWSFEEIEAAIELLPEITRQLIMQVGYRSNRQQGLRRTPFKRSQSSGSTRNYY